MVISNHLSYTNIYHFIFICYHKSKRLIDFLLNYCKQKSKFRNKLSRSNHILILCILFLILCLFFNQKFHNKKINFNPINQRKDIDLFINHIRNIAILNDNLIFNISYSSTFDGIPKWLNQYRITHFFNFYWLQNGAYLWHLQRMFDLKEILINSTITKTFHQIVFENSNQTNIVDYLNYHPEYGIIIDTAHDPIQQLFLSLPQGSLSFKKICEYLKDWYPLCQTRSEMISSFSNKSLITYALYDIRIDICEQCKHSKDIKINYYNEIIFLFNSKQQLINQTIFIRQILPRLIRLLAVTPESSFILLPYINTKEYIKQYFDIFIERGLINNRTRLIEYNSNEIYHSNVIYSTSSPRSDLILLNHVLLNDKPPVRRELILIIRENFDDYSYNQIIQTLNLFEFPDELSYLHIHEYNEKSYDLKQISLLFQQARIVIGMPTDFLSHIVWCQPRTHIIEIIQKMITTDFYEISLQLKFNYWLVMTTKTNQIDIIDFRNLIMKVLMDTDA